MLLASVAIVVVGIAAVYLTHEPAAPASLDAGPPDAGPSDDDAAEEAEGVDEGCGVCPPERPHCDRGEGLCVQCEEPEHCEAPLGACMNGRCVECETSRDCPSLELPECYFGTHACRPCTSDDACLARGEAAHCVEGRCTAVEAAP